MQRPGDPEWNRRWNERLAASPSQKARATQAWNVVLATLKNAQLDDVSRDMCWAAVEARLIEIANHAWPPAQPSEGEQRRQKLRDAAAARDAEKRKRQREAYRLRAQEELRLMGWAPEDYR
ncbi:hypothetical protein [Nocardioides sp. AN3]